jgi:hypothetical protein
MTQVSEKFLICKKVFYGTTIAHAATQSFSPYYGATGFGCAAIIKPEPSAL